MPRFYCPQPLAADTLIELPEAVVHHLHVLRVQAGATLNLFNGDGTEYQAELASIERRRASAMVRQLVEGERELPYPVTLAQALPEAAKMDWVIEKAVELGVAAVQPLAAQRCVVRLSGERAEKRHAHWQGVIVAASEQSGRKHVAQLAPLAAFNDWIAAPAAGARILLSPRATASLAHWARATPPQPVTFVIGPEGGYTAQEEDAAVAAGALMLSIGPRILRTETAGMAALAALNALWGGF